MIIKVDVSLRRTVNRASNARQGNIDGVGITVQLTEKRRSALGTE
jgi:hypothetical protein